MSKLILELTKRFILEETDQFWPHSYELVEDENSAEYRLIAATFDQIRGKPSPCGFLTDLPPMKFGPDNSGYFDLPRGRLVLKLSD